MLDSAPVYSSLTTKSMVFGIPSDSCIALGGMLIVFLGIVGFSFLSVGSAIALFVIVMPFLRRMFEKEPLAVDLAGAYLLQWPDYLPHHARVDKSPRPDVVPKNIFT